MISIMKKTIFTIFVLLAGFVCSAEVVTESQASQYARKFFRTSGDVKLVVNSEQVAGSNGVEAPAYYVFNNPAGGWVMISGENTSYPVLAYSRTGSFEAKGMPENIKHYMNGLRKDVRTLREGNLSRNAKIVKAWNTVGEIDRNAPNRVSKTIESAQWNQTAPYNKYVPVQGAPAGCVATAMSIVMRHNKWPEKPQGVTEAYTTSDGVRIKSRDLNGKTYKWDDMPMTDALKKGWDVNPVAELMFDCGCTVWMDYSTDGSGTLSEYVPGALAKYMKYSKSAKIDKRYLYTTEEWLNKLADELNNNRIIYYSGSGSGGHAFVCDGINTGANDEKYIRINWGWGGADNGFYTLDLYISSAYHFGSDQDAIFGLVPDPNGTSKEAKPEITFIPYGADHGIKLVSGNIAKGSEFKIVAGAFFNDYGNKTYDGEISFMLCDKDGAYKVDLPESGAGAQVKPGYLMVTNELPFKFNTDISVTDNIIAINRVKGYDEWEAVRYDKESAGFVPVFGVTDARIILYDKNVKAGDRLPLKLTPGQEGTKEVSWKFNGASVKKEITLVSGKNEIVADITYADESTETVCLTLNL